MHIRTFAVAASLLAAGTLAAASAPPAPPAPAATPAHAARAISDVTMDFFDGKTHQYEYFAVDGTSRARDESGAVETGRWYARPDSTVCFMHADPHQSGCVHVLRNEGTIEFHRVDGVIEGPFPYEPGNPHGL